VSPGQAAKRAAAARGRRRDAHPESAPGSRPERLSLPKSRMLDGGAKAAGGGTGPRRAHSGRRLGPASSGNT